MRSRGFGWDYPPGVTGREPEIAGGDDLTDFEDADIALVVFAPLKMEHKVNYVRVLDHEDGPPERWLVVPDNVRGESGETEPYWIEHPWKVVKESEEVEGYERT